MNLKYVQYPPTITAIAVTVVPAIPTAVLAVLNALAVKLIAESPIHRNDTRVHYLQREARSHSLDSP